MGDLQWDITSVRQLSFPHPGCGLLQCLIAAAAQMSDSFGEGEVVSVT